MCGTPSRWRIEYKHIDGRTLKPIKEGTQQGQVQRVSGYGMNGGDLFIKLFKISPDLTKEQRSCYNEMEKY